MSTGLSMQSAVSFYLASFRQFLPNERHITRFEISDVLLVMLDGVLRFSENGVPVELRRGEYYVQQKGLFQDGPEVSDCPFYYYVHFSGGEWSDDSSVLARRGKFNPDMMFPLLRELDDAVRIDAPAIVKNGLLCTILSRLYRGQERTEREKLIEAITRRLTEDLRDPPKLPELASLFYISENYLIRIFRESVGVTPHAYLISARLRRAETLLVSSDITADRVAYECGFSDYAHFYRLFRKKTGESPKSYRQRLTSKSREPEA